jgi:hypothetical protein
VSVKVHFEGLPTRPNNEGLSFTFNELWGVVVMPVYLPEHDDQRKR